MFEKLKSLLKSPFRLSIQSFLLFAPISIAAIPFAFAFRGNSPPVTYLILLGSLITSVIGLFYWLLLVCIRKMDLASSLGANLIILISVGLLRGLLFYYILDLFNIQNPAPFTARLLNSIYTVVFWIGLASLLVEANNRSKRKYRALLAQILILKLRDSEAPDPGYALLALDIAQIQLKIKKTIQDKNSDLMNSRHAEELAQTIRDELDFSLRPLSQRLWIKSLYAPPAAKIHSVISTAITELNYPFLLIAGFYAFSNVINTTQSLGVFAGALFAICSFLIFSVFELVRRLLTKQFSNQRSLINIAFVSLIGLLVGFLVNGLFDILGLDYSFLVAIFTSPTLPALIIAVSSIRLMLQDRKSLLEILSRKVAKQGKGVLDLVSHGNAASYLHNSLQSELTALALQLDLLAKNPDLQRNNIVMENIQALVSQSKSEDFKNFLETPQIRLERIVESWSGIASVSLDLDAEIWNDAMRSSIVVSLLQEAIANSVRSGKADHVHATGTVKNDSIFMTITDNGRATLTAGRRGIGSEWIDRIAVSDWKVEQSEQDRVLMVEI